MEKKKGAWEKQKERVKAEATAMTGVLPNFKKRWTRRLTLALLITVTTVIFFSVNLFALQFYNPQLYYQVSRAFGLTSDIVIYATPYIPSYITGGYRINTDLNIKYNADKEVELNWIPPTGATNTMLRLDFSNYPEETTDGLLFYEGNTDNITITELNFDDMIGDLYVTAFFQDASGNWFAKYKNHIGGLMSQIVELFPILFLVFMAFWVKGRVEKIYLNLIAALPVGAYGLYWYDKYEHPAGFLFSIALLALAVFMVVKGGYNLLTKTEEAS